jgi:hypothetical protein
MFRLVDCGADSDLRNTISPYALEAGQRASYPEISYITTLSNRQIGIYRAPIPESAGRGFVKDS